MCHLVGGREADLGLAVAAEDEALAPQVVELVKVQDGRSVLLLLDLSGVQLVLITDQMI